ncbi:fimbrial protein [Gallibacterium genomosp. 1]|uniref:Fimbrial protein n=1 Tax=Gallibacterium genomosp. 1 TaxID=155515 RepID=A0A0A2XWK3_9PAST|nr:fimbrial protein [Gallibacterium genomosp. 1]KGQ36781.1 fimbrial protein [Gallibacterium genomosp. 1]
MKKLLLTTLITAGLGLSAQGAFADDPPAQRGTITINGKIVDTTCTINEGTPDITVTLATISKSALPNQGATAMDTPFEIKLTNCSKTGGGAFATNEKIYAAFINEPQKVSAEGRLVNKATDTPATGVTVQIANNASDNTNVIDISKSATAQGSKTVAISGSSPTGSATLQYKARYYAETNSVTAGNVKGQVDYMIAYE